jgi:hypothetical protein
VTPEVGSCPASAPPLEVSLVAQYLDSFESREGGGDDATANLYHSFLQTPNATGDCGAGVVCAQYFFDLRNESLRAWLAGDYILGPTGLGHPAIRGYYLDDLWYAHGPGDMPAGVVPAACNLSAADVADLEAASELTLAMINNATLRAGGFNWQQLAQIPEYPNTVANAQPRCAPFMARYCGANASTQTSATLMVFSTQAAYNFWPLPFPAQDTAQFLLVRGPHAWLGYGWSSCPPPASFVRPPEVDVDYGEPLGFCAETAPGSGVWSREYTKYSVALDCASFTATLTPKATRDEPPAHSAAVATARREILRCVRPQVPILAFNAVQGQIIVFLISVFGNGAALAATGALSRLNLMFSVAPYFLGWIVQPYFSRIDERLVPRRFWQLTLGSGGVLALAPLIGFVWPEPFLWLLGLNYGHLRLEVGLLLLAGSIGTAVGLVSTLSLSRHWIFSDAILWVAPLTVGFQVLAIGSFDVTQPAGAITVVVAGNTGSLVAYLALAMRGQRKVAASSA